MQELAQLRLQKINNARPIAFHFLTEQSRRRVPGIVVTIAQVPVIRVVREEDPERFPHCSCQMGYDAIDRNDEIKLRNQSGCVVEIGERSSVVYYGGSRIQNLSVAVAHIFLQ